MKYFEWMNLFEKNNCALTRFKGGKIGELTAGVPLAGVRPDPYGYSMDDEYRKNVRLTDNLYNDQDAIVASPRLRDLRMGLVARTGAYDRRQLQASFGWGRCWLTERACRGLDPFSVVVAQPIRPTQIRFQETFEVSVLGTGIGEVLDDRGVVRSCSGKAERRPQKPMIDDTPRAPVRILKGMDPLEAVVRIGDVLGNRPQVELPLVPARCNPRMEIVRQLPQLDANLVRRYVHHASGPTRVYPGPSGPIEDALEHRVMKVEQVDIGWRPDRFRRRARPVEDQRAAARLCRAQNRLDFFVGRQHALLGLERFGAPMLSRHG